MLDKEIYFTVSELAERWRVTTDKVRGFIHLGQLAAVNVGGGSQKPRWRISDTARKNFEQARASHPKPEPRPRRRRPSVVKEYF